jgi:large subunit ribosomal protein L13
MKVYDGTNMILGRLACNVAKDALLGEDVVVVNCEKVIVSGKKEDVFAHYVQRQNRKGYPLKSRKLPRLSDRFVRKAIRGMLPWKQERGKTAFDKIMCHISVPAEFADKDLITVEVAHVKKLPNSRFVKVIDIVKHLGGKR